MAFAGDSALVGNSEGERAVAVPIFPSKASVGSVLHLSRALHLKKPGLLPLAVIDPSQSVYFRGRRGTHN